MRINLATALKFLSPSADPPVPWQRVISSAGKISSRGPGTDGAQRQREALEAEDVEVREGVGSGDELLVDLAVYGWFPDRVPWNGGGGAAEE
jgi:methylated-DNA-protein-cysteine methyltransferase-like protein